MGLGSAHRAAIIYAIKNKYEYLVTMDADFSHEPQSIPKLLEQLQEYEGENKHLKRLLRKLQKQVEIPLMQLDEPIKKSKQRTKRRHTRGSLKIKDTKNIPVIDLQDGVFALKQLLTYE